MHNHSDSVNNLDSTFTTARYIFISVRKRYHDPSNGELLSVCIDQPERMERIDLFWGSQIDLLSASVRSVAGGTELTDVTLVCEDGNQVHTHAGLLAALSKMMGELLATMNTLPAVIFIPEVKKEVVEKLMNLYSKRWDEVEVDLDLKQAADLLGLPLPSMTRRQVDVEVPPSKQTNKELTDSKGSKPTMPSMLVRVKNLLPFSSLWRYEAAYQLWRYDAYKSKGTNTNKYKGDSGGRRYDAYKSKDTNTNIYKEDSGGMIWLSGNMIVTIHIVGSM